MARNADYSASVKALATHAKKQIAILQTKKKKAAKLKKPALQAAIEGLRVIHATIAKGCQEMPQPNPRAGCQEMPRPGSK